MEFTSSRGFRFLRLDGQTPVGKRQGLVDKFNAKWGGEEQETVFLLSSKAGGVGLNLIGKFSGPEENVVLGGAFQFNDRLPT
jgi:DNA repair and recombination protein RAD54B